MAFTHTFTDVVLCHILIEVNGPDGEGSIQGIKPVSSLMPLILYIRDSRPSEARKAMFPDQDAWPRGDCRCKCDRTGYSHRHGDALPQKLYVSVDALGQDTLGALCVATVLTASHHARARQSLERLERT